MTDAGKDIENLAAPRLGMADAVGGEQRQARADGKRGEAPVEDAFAAQKVALDFDEEILAAKDARSCARSPSSGASGSSPAMRRRSGPPRRRSERPDPRAWAGNLSPCDGGGSPSSPRSLPVVSSRQRFW